MRISFTEISTVIEQSSRKRFAVSVNLAGLDFNKLLLLPVGCMRVPLPEKLVVYCLHSRNLQGCPHGKLEARAKNGGAFKPPDEMGSIQ